MNIGARKKGADPRLRSHIELLSDGPLKDLSRLGRCLVDTVRGTQAQGPDLGSSTPL